MRHGRGARELRTALARNGIDVLIAADESIRKAEDPIRVARLGAADIVVVKVAPLGGVARALEIVEACGLPAVVSSALDTSVGIAAGVALAAALPTLDHACGLGTVGLFERDVVGDAVAPDGRGPDDRAVPCRTRRLSPISRLRRSGSSGGATGSSAATRCSRAGVAGDPALLRRRPLAP